MTSPGELDLGPLSWVKDEIELALGRAGELLKKYGAQQEAVALHDARASLHQAHGALAIVGLDGVTEFSRAIERLLEAIAEGDAAWSSVASDAAQEGIATLRQYLDELIAGRPNQPLRLLPVYRRVNAARGAPKTAASDLFFPDLAQRPPKRRDAAPIADIAAQQPRLRAARLGFERGLSKWMKQDAGGIRDMRNSIAIIEAQQQQPAARAFWWVTLAWFDALAADGLEDDSGARRLCARFEAQVKKLVDGTPAVAERLMRDVLYEIATTGASSDAIEMVRAAYRLRDLVPGETVADEPRAAVLAEMGELLGPVGENWDQFCNGAAIALPRFHEQSAQLATLAQRLDNVDLSRLTAALANTANLLRKNPLVSSDALAVELATALLLTEEAIHRYPAFDVEFAAQVDALTSRLNTLQRGDALPPQELPSLRTLAQRATGRLAIHQESRELGAELRQVEQALDAFFRDAAHAEGLTDATSRLQRIAGLFAQIDQAQAAEVARDCARRIADFAAPGHQRQPGEFEQVARKISALGFFVLQLPHGTADLDLLLAPAIAVAATTSVEAELARMTRRSRSLVGSLRDAARDDAAREALRGELRQNLRNVRENARLVADEAIERQADEALAALDSQAPLERIEALLVANSAAKQAASATLTPASDDEVDSELFAIFVEEANEALDCIVAVLDRLRERPDDSEPLTVLRRCFHTLNGSSRMVGLADFSDAMRAVEATLSGHLRGGNATPALRTMLDTARRLVADWIDRLQRRAGGPDAGPLLRQCEAIAQPEVAHAGVAASPPPAEAETFYSADESVPATAQAMLPLFLEECEDLIPAATDGFHEWRHGGDSGKTGVGALQRILHTLKGSARMAGVTDIGAAIHGIETRLAEAPPPASPALIDDLESAFDRVAARIDELRRAAETGTEKPKPGRRLRAALIDAMVNESGEIAIARSRIEGGVKSQRASLADLTENIARLRAHLRELEIQTEARIQSHAQLRNERTGDTQFDPLEMDRFTRLQELTRILAESVNDVATVEHSLMRDLDQVDAALTQQARLSRELTQRLMSVRMRPFASIAERLQRVVRMTAEESGKRVAFLISGAETELDRSVLERVTAPIEHLLRNAVVHGIESPDRRTAAGKPARGEVRLTLTQAGNEVAISIADDGAGLDYARIRGEAVKRGVLAADQDASDTELAQLIYRPGFTTVTALSANAGRGVGMDVVQNESTALGGRVEVQAQPGRGATFTLHLPLTLAVIPAVLVKAGTRTFAIPSSMVVQASEMKAEAMVQLRTAAAMEWRGLRYALHYLPRLLGDTDAQAAPQRRHWVLLLRGGVRQLALELDALCGNEEVVIKNIGPQLARVPGISGATVLGDGEVVLIVNPIALLDARDARAAPSAAAPRREPPKKPATAALPPTVMVVDDSITVRKVAGRLLDRAGYRVVTAKDGVDALEQLAEVVPAVMLADIEMPRMDGFELVRRLRADTRFKSLPVIMITSRIADKHRTYAEQLGVNHYLGKPYDEQELLALIAEYIKPC